MAETLPPSSAVSTLSPAFASERARWRGLFEIPPAKDPRWAFGSLLTLYAVLGFSVFGFNRSPWQMLFIVLAGCVLELLYSRVVRGAVAFPLSAWISCCSLAILLNYSHGSLLPFLPVLIFAAGKHILTVDDRHVFNPSMFAVAVSLLVGGEFITGAPAYQWDGNAWTVSFFLVAAALAMFVFRVGRNTLILSFLAFYAINTGIRAVVMRHHLPPEMLFIGTMTTPPFFLFTMYMLTDPGTSPKSPKAQVVVALLVATVDLVLHLKESVFTFFYAALTVATGRFLLSHVQKARRVGARTWFSEEILSVRRAKAIVLTLLLGAAYAAVASSTTHEAQAQTASTLSFVEREVGFANERAPKGGSLLEAVDPRLLHVAKWVMSVGDAVAVGDVDNDGRLDVFLTSALQAEPARNGIYLNKSDASGLRFERLAVPVLSELAHDFKSRGLAAGGAFVDVDGDGDQDLFVSVAFGKSLLLQNQLTETGSVAFVDVSAAVGLSDHTVSLGGVFFDVDNDADLDLLVLNATTPFLPGYDAPTPLNVFDLPLPAYEGDRRALRFMHNGWHDADNGGVNNFYLNEGGIFHKQDAAAWGMPDTRWSLAAVAVDLNNDGFVDVYVANDFGPDDVYLNEGGKHFRHHKGGTLFNTVGNDTYKGMNATTADFDRNGHFDVYVSNVHHALQAEGSLLWMLSPSADPFVPTFSDEATKRGALNPKRFAWGAAAGDLDLDGYVDLVQANGMVDDRLDPLIPDGQRKDYWYVNHKLMQSGPEVHTYADQWGDIRGRTIFPNEEARVYRNLGKADPGYFVDVSAAVGLNRKDNARGVLLADLDNDGDLDAVLTNQHGPAATFENRARNGATPPHFVCVAPRGDGVHSHKSGLGARLIIDPVDGVGGVVGGVVVEEQTLMGGFSAQREPLLRVGLGEGAPAARAARVRFTSGREERVSLPVDRCVVVEEGKGVVP
jgi:hypothetical protein